MNMRLYAAVAALSLVSASAYAEEDKSDPIPEKISLTNACRLALVNNPGIQSIREQLVQQDGVLKEAKARMIPHLSASGSYETFDDDRLQSFGEGTSVDSSRWDASLDASMTVFSGGRNYQFIKGQEARMRSIGSSVATTEEDLLVLVHIAYYEAWLSNQRVEVQREAVSVFEEQWRVTKDMFNAGLGEKYDVTQAEVALANSRPPLIRALNDRRRSIDRLQEIIGLPYPEGVDASGIELEPLPRIKASGMDLKDAVSEAMKRRPEIKRTRHDVESAQRELRLAKRDQSPMVDLFAGYGIESDMFGSSISLEGWTAGVRVNWELFDGGSRRGKVQQARSKARQVEYGSTGLELAIEGEVRKAHYDRQEAASILEASEKVIMQAREALLLAQNRHKAGRGTQLEVLESQLQLTRARLEQSTARHDLELATVQMKRATGERIIQR